MKRWLTISILIASTAAVTLGRAAEKAIDLELAATFLAPPRDPSDAARGQEIRFDRIAWSSTTEGLVLTRMWNVASLINFKTTEDKTTVVDLRFNPRIPSQDNTWHLWRHRHGYMLMPSRNYQWHSLADDRSPLSSEMAEFYDRYLKELWSYWIANRLPRAIAAGESSVSEPFATTNHTVQTVLVKYDALGLIDDLPIAFTIGLWQMPVKIFLQVEPGDVQNGRRPLVVSGNYRWTYDDAEWRRLHGYEKDFWGGYSLHDGWPQLERLTKQQGLWLDELLDRCVAYWTEVAVETVLADLRRKIDRAADDLRNATVPR